MLRVCFVHEIESFEKWGAENSRPRFGKNMTNQNDSIIDDSMHTTIWLWLEESHVLMWRKKFLHWNYINCQLVIAAGLLHLHSNMGYFWNTPETLEQSTKDTIGKWLFIPCLVGPGGDAGRGAESSSPRALPGEMSGRSESGFATRNQRAVALAALGPTASGPGGRSAVFARVRHTGGAARRLSRPLRRSEAARTGPQRQHSRVGHRGTRTRRHLAARSALEERQQPEQRENLQP